MPSNAGQDAQEQYYSLLPLSALSHDSACVRSKFFNAVPSKAFSINKFKIIVKRFLMVNQYYLYCIDGYFEAVQHVFL